MIKTLKLKTKTAIVLLLVTIIFRVCH